MNNTSRFLQVKNWSRFQQYKDRRPTWIKIYVELLDDYDFGKLPDAMKAHLVGIWLLAAQTDNKIAADVAWITRKINATERVDVKALISFGFLQYENVQKCTDAPEGVYLETETYTEETEKERGVPRESKEPPMPNPTPVPAWESKAKESWSRHLGGENDYIFADLVPVVRRYGVSDTLEAWERYCAAQAEIEGGKFSSARSFAQKPGPWLKKPEPERRHKTVAELTKQALEELAVQG